MTNYKRTRTDLFYETKQLTTGTRTFTRDMNGNFHEKQLYLLYCESKAFGDKTIIAICGTLHQALELLNDYKKDDTSNLFKYRIKKNWSIKITPDLNLI